MDGMRMKPGFVDIGALEDIPRLGARTVKTPRGDVAVFRNSEDEIYALRDSCPHKQGVLSQGIVHGDAVTCPLHGWVISLRSGAAMGLDEGCTPRFDVHLEHGRVLLSLGTIA